MIEEGLKEIWMDTSAQEVLNSRMKDLNDMTVEQCEAALMMVCPVIKYKSEGKYIIGSKKWTIIKQGPTLILK